VSHKTPACTWSRSSFAVKWSAKWSGSNKVIEVCTVRARFLPALLVMLKVLISTVFSGAMSKRRGKN
jgi:hypothetical protein